MSEYVFSCCKRSINMPGVSAPSTTMQHLCLGDVPCIGVAVAVNITDQQAQVLGDVATEAVSPVTGAVVGSDGDQIVTPASQV